MVDAPKVIPLPMSLSTEEIGMDEDEILRYPKEKAQPWIEVIGVSSDK